MSHAWIAANSLFGSIWKSPHKEIIFDLSEKIDPPKHLWKSLKSEIAGAFTKDQIFGEGKDSAHDMCASCEKGIFKGKPSTIQDWRNLFTKIAIKEHKNLIGPEQIMKKVLVWMARTNPKELPGWIDSQLQMNSITKAWAAAYATVGAPWNNKNLTWEKLPPTSPSQTTSPTKPPPIKKTKKTQDSKPTLTKGMAQTGPASPYFLSRSEPTPQKNSRARR
jgi:hypothetical protein